VYVPAGTIFSADITEEGWFVEFMFPEDIVEDPFNRAYLKSAPNAGGTSIDKPDPVQSDERPTTTGFPFVVMVTDKFVTGTKEFELVLKLPELALTATPPTPTDVPVVLVMFEAI
jgi:hypothetical protein